VDGTDGRLVVRPGRIHDHGVALPVGAKRARLDDHDADPERAHLGGEHRREALDGELRGLASAHARCPAHAAADGGELQECSGSLCAQHGQRGAGHVDDAEQVGLDLTAEVVLRHLLDVRAVG
jgi:hypothetical protein